MFMGQVSDLSHNCNLCNPLTQCRAGIKPASWCCRDGLTQLCHSRNSKLESLWSWEFPLWLSGSQTWLASMRTRVRSLALLRGLMIWHCHELWYRCSSDSTPSLGTSICHGCVHPPRKKIHKFFDLNPKVSLERERWSLFYSFLRALAITWSSFTGSWYRQWVLPLSLYSYCSLIQDLPTLAPPSQTPPPTQPSCHSSHGPSFGETDLQSGYVSLL